MLLRMLPPAVVIAAVVALCGCSRGGRDTPLVRAVLLLSEEKLAEALVQCDQALSADPTNCQAWLLRGEINQSAGNFEEALVDYSRAIELDPENPDGHYYRNALLELQGTAAPHKDAGRQHVLEPLPLLAAHDVLASWTVDNSSPYLDDATYPENEIGSYEDRYEQADSPPYPNSHQQAARPVPSTIETPYQRWRKAQANKPTREVPGVHNPLAMPLDYYDWPDGIPSAPPPRQVTSFGYQLGSHPGLVPRPAPTTGRRRRWEPIPAETRRARFIGQRVPLRTIRTNSRACAVYRTYSPLIREGPGSLPVSPSCSDRLDNNGNGYTDGSDPACWLDGVNPGTYSPQLYEVGISPVIAPLPVAGLPPASP